MSNIAELERAVERLAPSELTAFRAWFVAYDADAWDREMQDDEDAGRLPPDSRYEGTPPHDIQ